MQISMIAAMAKNRVIGKGNDMPWHLPADLKYFKKVTLGKPVIMGRNTYESIGMLLPGRKNIIITRNPAYAVEGATTANSIESAIETCGDVEEVMIIGGGTIYQQALNLANKLYLTYIDLDVEGDTFFPDYESAGTWKVECTETHEADNKNKYRYEFVTLVRD